VREIITELGKMFDKEVRIEDERGYLEAHTRFIDQCLIVVDEAKQFNKPLPERDVLRQLGGVKKALEALGPEAIDHIEDRAGYRITDITEPGPVEKIVLLTEGYSSTSVRNAQQRRLLQMAQAIWPGKVSKYRDSRFGRFVAHLAEQAEMPAITDDVMRNNVDPLGKVRGPRIGPEAL
jgi:hypothetical protein